MSNLGVLLKIEFSKFLSTFAGKRGNRPGALFWVVFFLGVLFAGLSALYTFILSKAFIRLMACEVSSRYQVVVNIQV